MRLTKREVATVVYLLQAAQRNPDLMPNPDSWREATGHDPLTAGELEWLGKAFLAEVGVVTAADAPATLFDGLDGAPHGLLPEPGGGLLPPTMAAAVNHLRKRGGRL
jgi:hypothetical protein